MKRLFIKTFYNVSKKKDAEIIISRQKFFAFPVWVYRDVNSAIEWLACEEDEAVILAVRVPEKYTKDFFKPMPHSYLLRACDVRDIKLLDVKR